jgi:methylmalonyl-CoA/ethylmalonyl-CoA epimerase
MLKGIDHIAIAVQDLTVAIETYKRFGLKLESVAAVESQKVKVGLLKLGDHSKLELVSPLTSESSVAKFIATRGEGIHHIAIITDCIEDDLAVLKSQGFKLIDTQPRRGVHNTKVAFIHPKSTHGTLLELVEHSAE